MLKHEINYGTFITPFNGFNESVMMSGSLRRFSMFYRLVRLTVESRLAWAKKAVNSVYFWRTHL